MKAEGRRILLSPPKRCGLPKGTDREPVRGSQRRRSNWDTQPNDTRIWRLITAPSSCPGGTSDNSPTFQRWEPVPNVALVPKGRPKLCARSAVPSGLKAFYSQLPNVETLGYCRMSLRDEDQIRVIECGNPRNPVRVASSRWASASWLDRCNPFRVEDLS